MSEQELLKLAARYRRIADRAFESYQETGLARYDAKHRDYDDIATAMQIAADAAGDHSELIRLRAEVAQIADLAKRDPEEAGKRLLKYAAMCHYVV